MSRSRSTAPDGAERVLHLGDELLEIHLQRSRSSDDHEADIRRRRIAAAAIGFAQTATGSVTFHCVAQLPTHREADPTGDVAVTPEHDQGWSIDPLALLEERLEVGAPRQPLLSGEATAQTVSRLRPFARRRFRVLRPPCVFIRSRKPWVFARRRRFGWYVRFIASDSPVGC